MGFDLENSVERLLAPADITHSWLDEPIAFRSLQVSSDNLHGLQLPILKLDRNDSCSTASSERLGAALSDPWAVAPGFTGLVFGATAGTLSKHLALNPLSSDRGFRIGRAGVIWGLAGFAANYLGGAAAAYLSNTGDKQELCMRNREIGSLRTQIQLQQNQLNTLSQSVEKLLEKK